MNMVEGSDEAPQENYEDSRFAVPAEEEFQGACSIQRKSFMECLKHSNDDSSACSWAFDMLKECQSANKANDGRPPPPPHPTPCR